MDTTRYQMGAALARTSQAAISLSLRAYRAMLLLSYRREDFSVQLLPLLQFLSLGTEVKFVQEIEVFSDLLKAGFAGSFAPFAFLACADFEVTTPRFLLEGWVRDSQLRIGRQELKRDKKGCGDRALCNVHPCFMSHRPCWGIDSGVRVTIMVTK